MSAPAEAPSEAEETVAFLMSLRAKGIGDTNVLRAMETVPRDRFAPRRFADLARADVSLPLPCGQTMTAPGTIAAMLVALGVEPNHRVLEIGTGSGYVTAVLARLARDVLSVERLRTLALAAGERLSALGLSNARIAVGDGLVMGRELGAFHRILVNGTVERLPPSLVSALAAGGSLVVAKRVDGIPRLLRVTRTGDAAFAEESRESLRLPPLVAGVAKAL